MKARMIGVLCALGLVCAPAAAAQPLSLSSVSGSNFFGWCSGKTMLQELLPDATPPATPTGCGDYTNSNGTLTANFAPAGAGKVAASFYVINPTTRTGEVRLYANGVVVSRAAIPASATGWIALSPASVAGGDALAGYVTTGWAGSSGAIKVIAVHGELAPWSSPDWAQMGAAGSWATTPIPSGTVAEPGVGPHGLPLASQVPAELAGQAAANPFVNVTAYTAGTFYEPLSTPLQPVRLCRSSGSCVPSWNVQTDDLWKMLMGEGNNATMNRTTGKPVTDAPLGGGVPIGADVVPSPGTDKSATVCWGGGDSGDPPWSLKNADGSTFVRPDGQQIQGSCWELWGLQADPTYDPSLPISTTNTRWMVAWGAHRTGFISQIVASPSTTYTTELDTLSGQYCPRVAAGEWLCGGQTYAGEQQWFGAHVGYPGAPDSTTYEIGWGVDAAKLPMLTDIVQQHDCQAVLDGAADFGHAIGVQLQFTRYAGTGLHAAWWPAADSDGNTPAMATVEGMRLWFRPDVPMPGNLSAAGRAFFRTVQKYGIAVDDQTGGGPAATWNPDGSYRSGGSLNIRGEQPKGSYASSSCGQLGLTSALAGIPWSRLTLVKQGADGNADPSS